MEGPKGLIFRDLEETVAIIKSGQWLELIPLILNGYGKHLYNSTEGRKHLGKLRRAD